ncbi:helix-turn-helix domain-containing protein [Paraburkholderia aspalathi]|uniref:helix-turn-helix domain-containing protein n=1 Tax=Paraburkholderia aspalathi TaxID=1324617 RepID=UPI003C7FA93F
MRFKEFVGLSPTDYLTRWRMTLATARLTHSRDSVAEIGLAPGYESEKSFSAAFKRIMKCAPPASMAAGGPRTREGELRRHALRYCQRLPANLLPSAVFMRCDVRTMRTFAD